MEVGEEVASAPGEEGKIKYQTHATFYFPFFYSLGQFTSSTSLPPPGSPLPLAIALPETSTTPLQRSRLHLFLLPPPLSSAPSSLLSTSTRGSLRLQHQHHTMEDTNTQPVRKILFIASLHCIKSIFQDLRSATIPTARMPRWPSAS